MQDIDEEKRSQLLLQESEVKYKALFENNSVAVAILSMDGVFLEGNSKMAESLRLENKEDLVDMTPLDVSPVYQPDGKKSSERVQEYLKIIEKEGAFDFLWMNRRFDGDRVLGPYFPFQNDHWRERCDTGRRARY